MTTVFEHMNQHRSGYFMNEFNIKKMIKSSKDAMNLYIEIKLQIAFLSNEIITKTREEKIIIKRFWTCH